MAEFVQLKVRVDKSQVDALRISVGKLDGKTISFNVKNDGIRETNKHLRETQEESKKVQTIQKHSVSVLPGRWIADASIPKTSKTIHDKKRNAGGYLPELHSATMHRHLRIV